MKWWINLMRLRWYSYIIIGILALLVIELAVRFTGVIDYPVYEKSLDYGYIPKANQSGAFLRKNHWIFNERNMATGPYRPHTRPEDILMIGDSVVIGGNPLDQKNRLASQLEQEGAGRWSAWPVGAASWSAPNEMAWMKKNPDVMKDCHWLIWSMNSGDYYEFSVWVNNRMQPLHKPASALFYVLWKYIWDPDIAPWWEQWLKHPQDFPEYPDNMIAQFPLFHDYAMNLKKNNPTLHPIIMWFPAKLEVESPQPGWLKLSRMMEETCQESQIDLVNISKQPEWNDQMYRDFIHPNELGNHTLAQILARKMRSLEPNP